MEETSYSLIRPEDWLTDPSTLRGEWQGAPSGAGICVIANRLEEIGGGPRLHKHPYSETLIICAGAGLITVGDAQIAVNAGEIVVVPADTPHKFSNLGPGPFVSIDIHESGNFNTEWLV